MGSGPEQIYFKHSRLPDFSVLQCYDLGKGYLVRLSIGILNFSLGVRRVQITSSPRSVQRHKRQIALDVQRPVAGAW